MGRKTLDSALTKLREGVPVNHDMIGWGERCQMH
jgi:hypothetical protein